MPEFSGKYYTYADLWAGSVVFLDTIDEIQKRGLVYYSCMSVIIFSAFCLEAYLNHVGPHYYPTWNNNREDGGETWKRPREKLDLICEKFGITPDFGQRPFQSFTEIFKFRNLIAHAETTSLDGYFSEGLPEPNTEIQKKATPEFAHRYHEDTGKIIREIHNYFLPDDDPFIVIGEYGWNI